MDEALIVNSQTSDREEEVEYEQPQASWASRRCSFISIEPVVFLYAFYIAGSVPMTEQFLYANIALEYNTTIQALNNMTTCTTNHSNPDYLLHQAVQHESSKWMALLSATQLPFIFLSTLIVGSYSDRGGRKLGLILPFVGGLLKSVVSLVIALLYLPKEWLFLALILEGLTGGFGISLMATFAYVSDITAHQNRALRIVIVEAFLGLGIIAGKLGFGYILPAVGFMYTFVVLLGIIILGLLYTVFIVKETRSGEDRLPFFTWDHLKRLGQVCAKKDDRGRRWKLAVSVAILVITASMDTGKMDITILYVMNSPFCWNPTQVKKFQSAREKDILYM